MPSSGVTLTRDVRLLANFGISPDTREMPPLMKYWLETTDILSYYQWWHEVARMHRLESEGCPLSVHWPPGSRLTQNSEAEAHHRYET